MPQNGETLRKGRSLPLWGWVVKAAQQRREAGPEGQNTGVLTVSRNLPNTTQIFTQLANHILGNKPWTRCTSHVWQQSLFIYSSFWLQDWLSYLSIYRSQKPKFCILLSLPMITIFYCHVSLCKKYVIFVKKGQSILCPLVQAKYGEQKFPNRRQWTLRWSDSGK